MYLSAYFIVKYLKSQLKFSELQREEPQKRAIQSLVGSQRGHWRSRLDRHFASARSIRQGDDRCCSILHQPCAQRLQGKVIHEIFKYAIVTSGLFFSLFTSTRDVNHVNWVKLWLQLLGELQAYVKQHHTTGVSWNSTRRSQKFNAARAAKSGASSSNGITNGNSAAAAPPPPPPPPMPNFSELLAEETKANKQATNGVSNEALFAELNKGADITKGLRSVRDDQKTHKNPNLRAGAVVPAPVSSGVSLNSKASNVSNVSQKPPVFELVDKKWKVEFQQGRADLVIDQTDLKHTVYVYQCRDCTLTVKGKVNSILIDSCNKVGLLFDDVLSTVEFINSKNVQMQVLGRVPTVAIEKTDSCQVYLSRNSMDTEIVSSKSSSMNVLIPNANDDDYVEHPVPEQFKTVINANRKLTTTPTEAV
jgi:adenylyl cyclase-associated protein